MQLIGTLGIYEFKVLFLNVYLIFFLLFNYLRLFVYTADAGYQNESYKAQYLLFHKINYNMKGIIELWKKKEF